MMRPIIVILLLVCVASARAQVDKFVPLKTYSKKSTSLIADLKQQTKNSLSEVTTNKEKIVTRIYRGRLTMLQELVERGVFIQNDTLEQFVQRIVDTLLAHNSIEHKPAKILISRETSVNAVCFGEGTFMVTIGLLSKIQHVDHLAFALAHEIAHYELDHVKKQIIDFAERKIPEDVKEQLEKINTGDVTEEGMEQVRNYLLSIGQFNRHKEISADSLGFLYYTKAGFGQQEALEILDILDSANAPKYASSKVFFRAFNFSRYPFQEQWLNRLSVYSKDRVTHFLVPLDSMKTHPEFVVRKAGLRKMMTSSEPAGTSGQPDVTLVATLADFEMVHTSFVSGSFDRCLYYALQLKTRYPKNVFINTTIGKVLVILSEIKQSGSLITRLVPQYTQGYGSDLRDVNSFLHNITRDELPELAFYFLNHQDNFNPDEPDCYRLLWKACSLTNRDATKQKIKQLYQEKFPKAPGLQE